MADTHSTRGRRLELDLNQREPDQLRWVVDLIERFVIAHRGGGHSAVDSSGLGRLYRPRSRGEGARAPAPQRMTDRDLLALSRAWAQLPRVPWPFGQILRCSYLPGHPRPEIACRLMHMRPDSWVRERNHALQLLAEILRRDAAWLAAAR